MLAVGLEPTHQDFQPASVPHHGSTNINPLFLLQSHAPLVPKLGTGWSFSKNQHIFHFTTSYQCFSFVFYEVDEFDFKGGKSPCQPIGSK